MITVSYGHADKIAKAAADTLAAADTSSIDPALYRRDDVRQILADRDIAALYLVLKDEGITQRQIAELTGQSQSEVSEILAGRKVLSYDLLVRIADGLRIPRERMGLSYGGAYRGDSTVANPEEVAEMLRRHVLALGAIAAFGGPTVGELLPELGSPSPVPLPSRVFGVHVSKVRDLTRRLREAGRGSDPEVSTAAAAWAHRLLDAPGADAVKQALMAAVSELHIQAGWAGTDAGLHDRAVFHSYLQVLALVYAGLSTEEHGDPDGGLKLLQLGLDTTRSIPPSHELRTAVESVAQEDSATAYARLGYPEAADRKLAKARELWSPTNLSGDPNQVAACLELGRGRLDAAEQFAAASMRRWEGISERGRTYSGVVLATIHVRAGGLQLAHSAVVSASKLTSVRVRRRLEPLAEALEAPTRR